MSAVRKRRPQNLTVEEYLVGEADSSVRHEFIDGEVYAMAGASGPHNDLTGNTYASLHSQLRGKECVTRMMQQRLRIVAADVVTYPDVVVACPPLQYDPRSDVTLTDASAIIEVLSPGTAEYDRGDKFLALRDLASLRHYVLISQERVLIEHRRREDDGSWRVEIFTRFEDAVSLDAIGCTLSLGDVYERTGLQPGPEPIADDGEDAPA